MRSTRVSLLFFAVSLSVSSSVFARNGNHAWSAFVSTRGGLFHQQFNNVALTNTGGLGTVSAALAYSRYTRSSLFTLSGWASGLYVSGFNFSNFSVSGSGRKAFTPKLNLHFGAGVSDGFNYQDLIINGIFFVDYGVLSSFATTGINYDFTPSTSGFVNLHYNRFRFDTVQRIDGSDFVFVVPGNEEVLVPVIPDGLPFPTDTTENVIDASQLVAGLLAAEGTIETSFISESSLLTGGVSHQFGEATDVGAQIGSRFLDYERPGGDYSGWDTFVSLRLGHAFSPRTDMTGIYTFRRNEVFEPAIPSHTVVGRINRQVSVPIRIEGSLGFTYYPVPDSELSGHEIIGGIAASGAFARTSFHVSYQRRAQHSIGIGRYLTSDLANAAFSYVFSRDWALTGFAGYRNSRGTFDSDFFYTVFLTGTNLSYRVTEEVAVGGSYLFRYLDYRLVDYDTHLLSFFVTFGKIWK